MCLLELDSKQLYCWKNQCDLLFPVQQTPLQQKTHFNPTSSLTSSVYLLRKINEVFKSFQGWNQSWLKLSILVWTQAGVQIVMKKILLIFMCHISDSILESY